MLTLTYVDKSEAIELSPTLQSAGDFLETALYISEWIIDTLLCYNWTRWGVEQARAFTTVNVPMDVKLATVQVAQRVIDNQNDPTMGGLVVRESWQDRSVQYAEANTLDTLSNLVPPTVRVLLSRHVICGNAVAQSLI